MEDLWIPIVMFISSAIVIIFVRKYMNDERLAMIDKGMNLGEFKGKELNPAFFTLRFGLLLIGAGMGILFGGILEGVFQDKEVGYFSSIFIFGGLGLITAYLIEQKKRASMRD